MQQETRTVKYDPELKVEAYSFMGIMQKFPNHFHDYYVIGFIESGERSLSGKNREYIVEPGDLLLFNPRDSHTCEQTSSTPLDYRCINVPPETMCKAAFEITGKEYLPSFSPTVVFRSDQVPLLRELHKIIMEEERDFRKEEIFFFLLEQLIEEHSEKETERPRPEESREIGIICSHLERNYMKNITLDELSELTGLSKYYLLRSFTKQRGISPYRYLETIRIDRAKKLLEKGVLPIEAALQTGFTDQSHFTNFFKKFIGLTPKQYMNIFTDPSIEK